MSRAEVIKQAIQALLDDLGDGYHLVQFTVVMGLERVTTEGIESTSWVWSPEDQPTWMTAGLLSEGLNLLSMVDDE